MIFKKIKYTIANIQQTKPLVKLKTYKTFQKTYNLLIDN